MKMQLSDSSSDSASADANEVMSVGTLIGENIGATFGDSDYSMTAWDFLGNNTVGGNVILSCGIGDYKFRGDIFWFQGSFVNSGFHSVGFSSLFTNSLDLKVFRDTFVFVFVSQMQFQRFFVRAFK